jgi:hypothetical protein
VAKALHYMYISVSLILFNQNALNNSGEAVRGTVNFEKHYSKGS